jgi:hypothetical protein
MSNAYLYRMPGGIPGDISRQSQATVESVPFDSANAFSAYGLVGKIASGKFIPFAGGEADGADYGILVRPYPTASSQDGLGTSTPPTTGFANALRRGYITVKLNAGTAALNGTVYVRVASAGAGKPIGGFEAAADSTNTIVLSKAKFMSAADSNGNVEIAYNI